MAILLRSSSLEENGEEFKLRKKTTRGAAKK
jgi:hypothetical protein